MFLMMRRIRCTRRTCPTITNDRGEFDLLFKKYISILLVILAILLIIAFTLQPGSASAALAMHFVNVIAKVNNKLNHTTADWYSFYILVRKFAHSVEYLVMGVALLPSGDNRQLPSG